MIYLNIDCSLDILLKTPNSSLSSREKLKSILLNKLRNEYVTLYKVLSIKLGGLHSTETAC